MTDDKLKDLQEELGELRELRTDVCRALEVDTEDAGDILDAVEKALDDAALIRETEATRDALVAVLAEVLHLTDSQLGMIEQACDPLGVARREIAWARDAHFDAGL
jgi:hypothetical protein